MQRTLSCITVPYHTVPCRAPNSWVPPLAGGGKAWQGCRAACRSRTPLPADPAFNMCSTLHIDILCIHICIFEQLCFQMMTNLIGRSNYLNMKIFPFFDELHKENIYYIICIIFKWFYIQYIYIYILWILPLQEDGDWRREIVACAQNYL